MLYRKIIHILQRFWLVYIEKQVNVRKTIITCIIYSFYDPSTKISQSKDRIMKFHDQLVLEASY